MVEQEVHRPLLHDYLARFNESIDHISGQLTDAEISTNKLTLHPMDSEDGSSIGNIEDPLKGYEPGSFEYLIPELEHLSQRLEAIQKRQELVSLKLRRVF